MGNKNVGKENSTSPTPIPNLNTNVGKENSTSPLGLPTLSNSDDSQLKNLVHSKTGLSDDYDTLDPWQRVERIPHILSIIGRYLHFKSILVTQLVSTQWKKDLSPFILPCYKYQYDPNKTYPENTAYILSPSKIEPHQTHVVGVILQVKKNVLDLDSSSILWEGRSRVGYLSISNLEQGDLKQAVKTINTMFSELTHLALAYCGNAWEILGEIGKCNKLEWLELAIPADSYSCRGQDKIYPKWTLPSMPIKLPYVKTLKMSDIGSEQLDQFVEYVLPGLPGLTCLSQMKFSNSFVENLGKYCPQIKYLHFNQPSLTDIGMSHLLQLPNLKSLRFYCLNQSQWTGEVPPNVVNKTLEILELDSMCSVKSILPIAKACPNLKEFSGNYLKFLDDHPEEESKEFMNALPLLRKFVGNEKTYLPRAKDGKD